jgi:hypothetical protein
VTPGIPGVNKTILVAVTILYTDGIGIDSTELSSFLGEIEKYEKSLQNAKLSVQQGKS